MKRRLKIFSWLGFLMVMFAGSGFTTAAFSQQWHIANPPVEHPVPQYHSPPPAPPELTPSTAQITVAPLPPVDFETKPADALGKSNNTAIEPAIQPESVPSGTPLDHSHPPTNPLATVYGLDYSFNRDRTPFPTDPRKPCNPCTQPQEVVARSNSDLPGLRGRPYQEQETGGCRCGKKGCPKCKQASVYWPRPFSAIPILAKHDQQYYPPATCCDPTGTKKRLVDIFDPLVHFKLVPYQRRDNGYCGRGSDPYGCLGESRQQAGNLMR